MTIHGAGPSAALAGVPAGIQSQGVWAGRRQLFVRFAAEAETAVMYTAAALAKELKRCSERSTFHSISLGGRDVLANVEFLDEAFRAWKPELAVMLDTDGQRPEAVPALRKHLAMVQVTLDPAGAEAMIRRGMETIEAAASMDCDHALVLAADSDVGDARLLRIVEQAHQASSGTMIVIHPAPGADPTALDRHWAVFLEQASAVHGDVRVLPRVPPPAGLR